MNVFTVKRVGKNTINMLRTLNCLAIGRKPPADSSPSLANTLQCGYSIRERYPSPERLA
jgi:hypothetical protein